MRDQLDCVVSGLLCIDVPLRPIDRRRPLEELGMLRIDAIRPGGGGIVANSGMALAKLGMRTAALASIGEDVWADVLTGLLSAVGVDTSHLLRNGEDTSATAVLVAEDGEHTFGYFGGASHRLDRSVMLDNLELFARSKFALFGYYALMPELEEDLPEVLSRIRETGCRTALDAGGGGGGMRPLDRIRAIQGRLPRQHAQRGEVLLESSPSRAQEADPGPATSACLESLGRGDSAELGAAG